MQAAACIFWQARRGLFSGEIDQPKRKYSAGKTWVIQTT
jgi:hypothetical protein